MTLATSNQAIDKARWDVRLAAGSLLHGATSGALAGAVAGALAGGVGGRLAMRVTAIMATEAEQGALTEAGETVGDITIGGTVALIIFGGILFGVLGGLVYAATSRWFRDAGAARGLLFGAFLLASLGWTVIEGDNFDFATFGAVTVNLAMFAGIFILFGILVAPLYEWMRRSLPPPSLGMGGLAILPAYALGLLITAGVLSGVIAGFGEDGSLRPFFTIVPLYLIGGMTFAALLISRRLRFERVSDLRTDPLLMLVALTLIALPISLGLLLDAAALRDILGDAY